MARDLSETELKAEIVTLLRSLGYRVYVTSERRKGYSKMPVGWPDLFVRHVGKRRCAWIEVKRRGEKLRPAQVRFRDEALTAGETHVVVDTMDDVMAWLAA